MWKCLCTVVVGHILLPIFVFFVLNLVTWEDARKGRVIFSQRNSMCWTRIWPQISNKCRYAYWTVDHSTWKKSHFRKSRTWVPYYLISLELGVKPVFLPPLSRLNLLIFWSLIVNLPNKEPLFHKEIGKKKKKSKIHIEKNRNLETERKR